MAFANLIHGFCRFDSKAFELIDWNAKEFHHFQTSRSSNYPQLSVAHGVRDIMRGVQFMQMMGAPEMRERYTNDTKTKNVPFKFSLSGSALHSLTEYTFQNKSDPHLLRL